MSKRQTVPGEGISDATGKENNSYRQWNKEGVPLVKTDVAEAIPHKIEIRNKRFVTSRS